MNPDNPVLHYLMRAGNASLFQILFFVCPTLITAFFINLSSRLVERESIKLLGPSGYIYLFGWLGTFFHESGHALFCIVFRHKINEIKFFTPFSKDGTLGYVKHSFDSKNIYQRCGNFFIGVGPIITGALAIYVIVYVFFNAPFSIPDTVLKALDEWITSSFSQDALKRLIDAANYGQYLDIQIVRWDNWVLWLMSYIIYCIGSSMSLSKEDLNGAFSGFVMILLVVGIVNILLAWLAPTTAGSMLYPFAGEIFSILILTLLLNAAVFILLKTLNVMLSVITPG